MRRFFHERTAILSIILSLGSLGNAAVIFTDPQRLIWEFTLVRTGTNTGASDLFSGQYGPDELDTTDLLSVVVSAQGQSVPVYSRISRGTTNGLNGFLFFQNWDTAFPNLEGTVTMEILEGSVDIERISISVETPGNRYVASISPNIRLVPEPEVPLMAMLAAPLIILRRRRFERAGCRLPLAPRGLALPG